VDAESSLLVGNARVSIAPTTLVRGTRVHWSVRPEYVEVNALASPPAPGDFEGRLVDVVDTGLAYEIFVEHGVGDEIRARATRRPEVAVGQRCRVVFAPEAVSVWPTSP
jgi:hypothetical protein